MHGTGINERDQTESEPVYFYFTFNSNTEKTIRPHLYILGKRVNHDHFRTFRSRINSHMFNASKLYIYRCSNMSIDFLLIYFTLLLYRYTQDFIWKHQ